MKYRVLNQTKNTVIAQDAVVAKTFFERLAGLMLRKDLGKDSGMLFYHGTSIHTCFMLFAIDLVFLDKALKVVRVADSCKPWRFFACLNSYLTIELPAGKARSTSTGPGDAVKLVEL